VIDLHGDCVQMDRYGAVLTEEDALIAAVVVVGGGL